MIIAQLLFYLGEQVLKTELKCQGTDCTNSCGPHLPGMFMWSTYKLIVISGVNKQGPTESFFKQTQRRRKQSKIMEAREVKYHFAQRAN